VGRQGPGLNGFSRSFPCLPATGSAGGDHLLPARLERRIDVRRLRLIGQRIGRRRDGVAHPAALAAADQRQRRGFQEATCYDGRRLWPGRLEGQRGGEQP